MQWTEKYQRMHKSVKLPQAKVQEKNARNVGACTIVLSRDRLMYQQYLGFTDISVSAKMADKSASVGVDKALLHSSRVKSTCARNS